MWESKKEANWLMDKSLGYILQDLITENNSLLDDLFNMNEDSINNIFKNTNITHSLVSKSYGEYVYNNAIYKFILNNDIRYLKVYKESDKFKYTFVLPTKTFDTIYIDTSIDTNKDVDDDIVTKSNIGAVILDNKDHLPKYVLEMIKNYI